MKRYFAEKIIKFMFKKLQKMNTDFFIYMVKENKKPLVMTNYGFDYQQVDIILGEIEIQRKIFEEGGL